VQAKATRPRSALPTLLPRPRHHSSLHHEPHAQTRPHNTTIIPRAPAKHGQQERHAPAQASAAATTAAAVGDMGTGPHGAIQTHSLDEAHERPQQKASLTTPYTLSSSHRVHRRAQNNITAQCQRASASAAIKTGTTRSRRAHDTSTKLQCQRQEHPNRSHGAHRYQIASIPQHARVSLEHTL
jgi:hypothetical protein